MSKTRENKNIHIFIGTKEMFDLHVVFFFARVSYVKIFYFCLSKYAANIFTNKYLLWFLEMTT